MIKYQDEILEDYLMQLSPTDQSAFMQKYQTLDNEKKNLILHNLATTMPKYKDLLMQQEPQVEFMYGGEKDNYQNGGGVFGKIKDLIHHSDSIGRLQQEAERLWFLEQYDRRQKWLKEKKEGSKDYFNKQIEDYQHPPPSVTAPRVRDKEDTEDFRDTYKYQYGGERDATETGRYNKRPRNSGDGEEAEIFFDDSGEGYVVRNGKVGEKVDPKEWRSIPGGKFRRTATIANPRGTASSPSNTASSKSTEAKSTDTPKAKATTKASTKGVITDSGAHVKALQEKLHKAGFLPKKGNTKNGKWDGLLGPITAKAAKAYEASKNQPIIEDPFSDPMSDNTDYIPPEFKQQQALRKAQEEWFYNQLGSKAPAMSPNGQSVEGDRTANYAGYGDPAMDLSNGMSRDGQPEQGRDIARELKESGISGVIGNTVTPDVQEGSYSDRVSKSLERLYASPMYQEASFLEKIGMQAEIDPLSFFVGGMGASLGTLGAGSVPYKTRMYPAYPTNNLGTGSSGLNLPPPRPRRSIPMDGERYVDPNPTPMSPYYTPQTRHLETPEVRSANRQEWNKGVKKSERFIESSINDRDFASKYGLSKGEARQEFNVLKRKGEFTGTYDDFLKHKMEVGARRDDFGGMFNYGGMFKNPYK